MSVVLVTPDSYETLRMVVRCLRAQTVHDRLEIVIVAPAAECLGVIESDLAGFARLQVVPIGVLRSAAKAVAAGVRAARAPVVVFCEDHCYPAPGWAEALIAAHRQPWAAVGPVMENANPRTATSWAKLYLQYGAWVGHTRGAVMEDIPGHNSSYKRAVLLGYGEALEAMLHAESLLHEDLRRRGHQLYLEPAAKAYHVNITRFAAGFCEVYLYGRFYAGARASAWSAARRLLYACGSPLIPAVRLRRILRQIVDTGRHRELLPRILPPLAVALIASAAGEMVGYVLGMGRSQEAFLDLEFRRYRYVGKQDWPPLLPFGDGDAKLCQPNVGS